MEPAAIIPALLSLQIAASTMMAGLIWFVQIVHYPLFAAVGPAEFALYSDRHRARTTYVVAPLMLAEAICAAALVVLVGSTLSWIGLTLVAVLWLSTFAVQVPLHARLAQGWEVRAGRLLVATNWVRTLGWTTRAAIAFLMSAA